MFLFTKWYSRSDVCSDIKLLVLLALLEHFVQSQVWCHSAPYMMLVAREAELMKIWQVLLDCRKKLLCLYPCKKNYFRSFIWTLANSSRCARMQRWQAKRESFAAFSQHGKNSWCDLQKKGVTKFPKNPKFKNQHYIKFYQIKPIFILIFEILCYYSRKSISGVTQEKTKVLWK